MYPRLRKWSAPRSARAVLGLLRFARPRSAARLHTSAQSVAAAAATRSHNDREVPLIGCGGRRGGVDVYVKAEAFNPGSSVKDRLALGAIAWGEQAGAFCGGAVVEATSNTGIGLCVCAATGPRSSVAAEASRSSAASSPCSAPRSCWRTQHKGGMVHSPRARRRLGRRASSSRSERVGAPRDDGAGSSTRSRPNKKPDAVVLAYDGRGSRRRRLRRGAPDAKIIVCSPTTRRCCTAASLADRRGRRRRRTRRGARTCCRAGRPTVPARRRRGAAGHVERCGTCRATSLATARARGGEGHSPARRAWLRRRRARAPPHAPRGSVVVAMLPTRAATSAAPLFGDSADTRRPRRSDRASAPTAPTAAAVAARGDGAGRAFVAATSGGTASSCGASSRRVLLDGLQAAAIGVQHHKVDIDSFEFAETTGATRRRRSQQRPRAAERVFTASSGAAPRTACIAWRRASCRACSRRGSAGRRVEGLRGRRSVPASG